MTEANSSSTTFAPQAPAKKRATPKEDKFDSIPSSSSPVPSSPLSVLARSPSPPTSPILAMDASKRYPSPNSSALPSRNVSPLRLNDADTSIDSIYVDPSSSQPDQAPPRKRRRISPPKPRTMETVDLENITPQDESHLDRLLQTLRKKKKIVVIAGAGISVSAGIPDFRSSTGLFATLRDQYKLKSSGQHLFDASVYKDDNSTSSFHAMVRELAQMTSKAQPTPFHHMLASIAEEGRLMRLYTQNVDGIDTMMPPLATRVPLNAKGPWPTTIQLHGGLEKMVCTKCGHLEPFNGAIFEGPRPPLCHVCRELDQVRTAHAGKRSHGIGRLRPRIVLYNEYNPDQEAIGNVSKADLRRVPDAVIVVGTSLKIPGVRRIVKEMCLATRSKRDGFTAWINTDPVPQGSEFKECWDLNIKGKSDDVAELAGLPYWDEQDIGDRGEYMVTGDKAKEKRCELGLVRDRIQVLLARRRRELEAIMHAAAQAGPNSANSMSPSPSSSPTTTNQDEPAKQTTPQAGIPTPTASPKLVTKGKARQRKSLPAALVKGSAAKPSGKVIKARKPRVSRAPLPTAATTTPKNNLSQVFKATKAGASRGQDATAKKVERTQPEAPAPPVPAIQPKTNLPSLRPARTKKAPEPMVIPKADEGPMPGTIPAQGAS